MQMKLQSGSNTYASSQELPLSGVDSDTLAYIRLGWWIIIAGIGGFLLWASLAPLDKGVPLSGTVTVTTNRKAIQHQTGGTIEDTLVKEGDVVEAGTVRNLTPHIPGIVTQVSADRFVDENTGEPYYKLQAEVAPEGMKMIADLQIKAGMPVDLFVKTGERTMMNYILRPILDHLKMAMSED